MARSGDKVPQRLPSLSDRSQDQSGPSINSLLQEQLLNEHELMKLMANTKKTPYERRNEGYYNKRLELADELWTTCRHVHRTILRLHTVADDHHPYFKEDKYGEMEELYCTLVGYIQEQIKSVQNVNEKDTAAPAPTLKQVLDGDLRLPRISLPQFSGGYRSWTTFRDIFTSLVHHNKVLSDVQKLHYLKSSVSGEAGQLIRHLAVTDANYNSAWDILMRRYQNQRALVNAQLQMLFTVPMTTAESASNLKRIVDTTNEGLEGLKVLKIDTSTWDPILIYLLTRKLPSETVTHWETFLSRKETSSEVPTLQEFLHFLEIRFRTLDAIQHTNHPSSEKTTRPAPRQPTTHSRIQVHTATLECPVCKQEHPLRRCQKFINLNLQARRDFIKKQLRCFNCLGASHSADRCPNPMSCQRCGKRHHTLLHMDTAVKSSTTAVARPKPTRDNKNMITRTHHSAGPSVVPTSEPQDCLSQEISNPVFPYLHSHVFEQPQQTVLLATALVEVPTPRGGNQILRALLDQGSQASFITEDAAQRLQLARQPTYTTIRGIGKTESGRARGIVRFTINSRCCPDYQRQIDAFILPAITGRLPASTTPVSTIRHLQGIQLADPTCLKPGPIDVLLGADVYADVIQEGVIKGTDGTPTAQYTSLGWILSGRLSSETSQPKNPIMLSSTNSLHCELDLHKLLTRFWEVEKVPEARQSTPEDDLCEDMYVKTLQRKPNGRYMVSLPFAPDEPILGESRSAAIRRLLQMEKRFTHHPDLAQEYIKFMREYESLGHMELVPACVDHAPSSKSYYLPHHAVFKADSSTTKVRVVFDASSKTTNGRSLNDCLLTGPALQNDLSETILRWRQHRVALTADIEKMYRQILVDKP